MRFLGWLVLLNSAALAQQPLTLREAVQQALRTQPALQSAGEQVRAAESRMDHARSRYLPKINYSESVQRSDNPVFVFGALLTQHQFTEANFSTGPLNRPDFLNNFQSLLTLDQTIWDGTTKRQVEIARLHTSIGREDEKRTRLQTIARVIESYFGVRVAQANLAAAREALRSAEADLERAETVRKGGMSFRLPR